MPATVEMIVTDGVPSPEDATRVSELLGCSIMPGFAVPGLPVPLAVNAPDVAEGHIQQRARKVGTAGRALPNTAIHIVSDDTGMQAAPGENGRVMVFGPLITNRQAEPTANGREGWLSTDCHASVDEEGFITPA